VISTIVVGTDGSRTARRAVAVAADLARGLDAELHVVHGYWDPVATAPGPGGHDPGSDRWRESSATVLADALADPVLDGVRVRGHSVGGGVVEALVTVAQETAADLIVVGNRGMRGAASSAESVPARVARASPCHVLIAKTT
jgi:nucleotide-binding universal stress UspA family protein